jgi:hypothetical protein
MGKQANKREIAAWLFFFRGASDNLARSIVLSVNAQKT